MTPEPPTGQNPVNPQTAFHGQVPPPQSGGPGGWMPPQPPQFPPGSYPPPPPQGWGPPPQKSFLRRFASFIYTTVALVIFAGVLFMALAVMGFAVLMGGGAGPVVRETPVAKGDRNMRIALIPVQGMIDDTSARDFNAILDKVEADSQIVGIILEIDTPGGTVTASDQMHHRLSQFKANRGIPVVVAMGGLATSGGYYISAGADQIFAQPTTWTGNIGVMMPRYNLSGLAEKIGLEDDTLHSTDADFKTAGSMLRDLNPQERIYLQGLLDDASGQFKSVVISGRGSKLARPASEIFSGKVFTATQAKGLGLIDSIGYTDDAVGYLAGKIGVSQPEVIRLQILKSPLEGVLSGSSHLGQAQGSVQINLDSRLVQQFTSPQPMYLWRGQ